MATAAATPLSGEATCTATEPNAGTAPGICRPSRESAIRAVTGPMVPAAVGVPARVKPMMSTISCTAPDEPLNNSTTPLSLTGTITVVAMVRPAWKFRFDVSGRVL